MTAENLFLGLQNEPETVRKFPLYTSVNNLFEQIFSLNHVVGAIEMSEKGNWEFQLVKKELQMFLQTLLEDGNRISWKYDTQEAIRKLSGEVYGNNPRFAGYFSRTITEDRTMVELKVIDQETSGNQTQKIPFQLDIYKGRYGDVLEVFTDRAKQLLDPNPKIYDYRGFLEGFKRILDNRKKLDGYLHASA